ncbi:MAG TPA: hypothetical protein VGM56_17730 [Byssovorax sp.]
MSLAFLRRAVVTATFTSASLLAGLAFADDGGGGGVRFRGGIAGEGGMLFSTGIGGATLGVAGIQGQAGVQITNLVGVYAVPSADLVFGDLTGLNLGGAVLVDFTIVDRVAIGGGPEVGAFVALSQKGTKDAGAAAAVYGGRVHVGVYPFGGGSGKRSGLEIGADLHLDTGPIESGTVSLKRGLPSGFNTATSHFLLAPMLTIGYASF